MTQTQTPTPTRTSQSPRRLEPRGPVRLTGRGAMIALFAFSFLSLLMAAWTGWTTLAYVAFVCGCGVVTYYTRVGGLRAVVVSPPLIFLAACACAQAATASDSFAAAEGILVTLGTSAPWLFTATALTVAIAIGRGYRPWILRLPTVKNLLSTLRDGRTARLAG